MNRYHFDEICYSNHIIAAKKLDLTLDKEYHWTHYKYPDIHIPNRALAYGLAFSSANSETAIRIRKEVDDYDAYLTAIEGIPGFFDFFIQNDFCVSREDILKNWSEETADQIFSLKHYNFYTDLTIMNGYLFDCSIPANYQLQIENDLITMPIGKPAWDYPDTINGKKAIWNYIDNGHDFCFEIWKLLGKRARQDEDLPDDEEDDRDEEEPYVYYYFDIYSQTRYDDPEPQLVKIFKKLESLGYLESYTLKSESKDPRWVCFGKSNGTIDLALVDLSFLKNSLLMEQIELLLWQLTEDIKEGQCFLTDKNGKQYIADHRGKFGGHDKLKIYGRLDCPSAARYIAKGQYVRHRVFFEKEDVAIAAGYRPCDKCMPEAYKLWKSKQKKDYENGAEMHDANKNLDKPV